jgi:hypothetical protein
MNHEKCLFDLQRLVEWVKTGGQAQYRIINLEAKGQGDGGLNSGASTRILHIAMWINDQLRETNLVIIKCCIKNGVFWDVTPCGSCRNRRFRGT